MVSWEELQVSCRHLSLLIPSAPDGFLFHIDKAGIQFQILNRSKGAAAQGPRAQIDRTLYKRNMQDILFRYPNLDVRAGSVFDLVLRQTNQGSSSAPAQKVEGIRLGALED
jgi:tRNA uridine 5-carboxymethylaminomethyl modification enzyme